MTLLSGRELKLQKKQWFKILNTDFCHNNFQYKLGVNKDILPFDPRPNCGPGGLYFTERAFLHLYLGFGDHIALVDVPDDAQVCQMENKLKTDQLELVWIKTITQFFEDAENADLVFKCIAHNGCTLKYVTHQTEELCRLAVQQDGLALKFVLEQTEELCRLAVHQDGRALKYVRHQTEKLCRLAVQQDGLALEFVQKQTDELCRLAVQQNGWALKYVRHQTEKMCRLAVQQDGRVLQYVKKQTVKLCRLAVQQNRMALEFVLVPNGTSVSRATKWLYLHFA